jgi:hypothetical protein
MRGVVGLKLPELKNENTKGYISSEYFAGDGFVESPQNFNRLNIMSKISTKLGTRIYPPVSHYFIAAGMHPVKFRKEP